MALRIFDPSIIKKEKSLSCLSLVFALLLLGYLPLFVPKVAIAESIPIRNPAFSCHLIRIADTGREDVVAINAVFSFLARKLGYSPITVFVKPEHFLYRMKNHGIDVFLAHWNTLDAKNDALHVFSNPILDNLEYNLAVPSYLKKQGLHSLSDIPRFAEELNSTIFSIDESFSHNEILSELVASQPNFKQFKVQPIPSREIDNILDRMVNKEQPFVMLSWQPNSQNRRFQLSFLQQTSSLLAREQQHLFPRHQLYAIAKTTYVQTCPNVARLMKNLSFDTSKLEELMSAILMTENPVQALIAPWLTKQPRFLARTLKDVTNRHGDHAFQVVLKELNTEIASSP